MIPTTVDPPEFGVSVDDEWHIVSYADDEFTCHTCGATGYNDDYSADEFGAQKWHRSL